jgi:hypothetical protein
MQGFKFVSTSKKRYKDRNLQGDSKYKIEKNMVQNQNLYPALKQICDKHKNLTILVLLLLLMVSSLFRWIWRN